jgi:hypothetical protein
VLQCFFVTVYNLHFPLQVYDMAMRYISMLKIGRASEGPHCLLFQWLEIED